MSFTDTPADQATPNETVDQPLSFNVGERTFNAESATTKIQAADEHIARLEAENASYKAKVEQSTSIDEALAQLRTQNDAPTQNSQPTEHTSPVSEEQIGEIAKKQMAEYLAAQRIESNATAAQALAQQTEKFVDYSKPITSSTITAALNKAGATYN